MVVAVFRRLVLNFTQKAEEKANSEAGASLKSRGCEVTEESKQTGPLVGTYHDVEPLKSVYLPFHLRTPKQELTVLQVL